MTKSTVPRFRQTLMSALPDPLRLALRQLQVKFRRQVDFFYFPVWLVFQCARYRKKAVILFRLGALGDVVCTLPMCGELRKRHPGKLLIYVTMRDYVKMVRLSSAADSVYGSFWQYGTWKLPAPCRFGLVEEIYCPQTTDERLPHTGARAHLVDDLAGSCGLTIPDSNRQPRLFPSPELIKRAQSKYGLAGDVAAQRLIIGINCGHTWPVKLWEAAKWQALVELIHAECDAAILQLGFRQGDADEFDHFRGVQHVLRMMMEKDELVALVASCHLMVSIDSGPVHLAGAVGVPVVGLYGALEPRHYLPPDSPSAGVFSDVPCRFCHHATPQGHWQSGCPNDIRCMKELDVPAVFQAVKSALARARTAPFSAAATSRIKP
jgi:ADP-heptose:LPS heptosyltransferase